METAICKTAEETQDDVLISKPETKGFLPSEPASLVASSLNKEDKLSMTSIDENNQKINGLVKGVADNPEVIQTPKNTEILSQKSLSPTLIEHALIVVKKLFSPEENKRKCTNVLNSINSQPNPTLLPCNSLYIPNKPNFSSEAQVEVLENVAKGDHSSINQLGVMRNSLTIDSHNNTNDSFLTAVSLVDDSFQSTVTHLDENGEVLKCGGKIMENSLNDSFNVSMSDSQDDMSPVSESYLENTMLKNGSFTTLVTKSNDNVYKSKEENFQKIQVLDTHTEVLSKIQSENEVLIEGPFERSSLKENTLSELAKENEKNLFDKKVQYSCDAESVTNNYPKSNKVSSLVEKDIEEENDKTCQTLKTEELFLNESCKNYLNSHKTSELLTEPYKNNENSLNQGICELNQKTLEKRKVDSTEGKKNHKEADAVSSIGEQEITTECSISTTTVVLGEDDFVDLDTMLMDLKKDEVGRDLLSASYFEGSESITLENFSENHSELMLKKFRDAKAHSKTKYTKSSSKLNEITLTEKKMSKSERSSPNKLMNPARNKLNKSVDFIRETCLGKSPKEKKDFTEKSSLQSTSDISLSKNIEAESILNIYLPKDDVELSKDELQIISSVGDKQSNKNKEKSQLSENNNPLELNKSKVEVTEDESDALSVVSQQSYTILSNTVNQNLKRPVINFLEYDENDLQINVELNSEKISNTKFYKPPNDFLNEFSDNSSENSDIMETPKQSTPILRGCNELRVLEKVSIGNTQTFVEPTSLTLLSDLEKLNNGEKVKTAEELESSQCYSKPDLLGKAMEIFSLNEEQISFSPVTPLNEGHVFLSNSLEKELEADSNRALDDMEKEWALSVTDFKEEDEQSNIKPKSFTSISTSEKNEKKWKSQKPVKGNEIHGKKLRSPEPLDLNIKSEKETESSSIKFNETYEKKPESVTISKVNEIFEKNTGSPYLHPPQLNKTFDKISGTLTAKKLNQTYEKISQSPPFNKINQTTDKNKSCCEPTQILKTESLDIKHCFEMVGETNKTFEMINSMPLGKSKKFSTTFDKESGDVTVTSPDENNLVSHQVILTQSFLTGDEASSSRSELTFLKEDANEIPQTVDGTIAKDPLNDNFINMLSTNASFSTNDTVVLNQELLLEQNLAEGVVEKVENIKFKESMKKETEGEVWSDAYCALPVENLDVEESLEKQTALDTIASPFKGSKLQFDPDLVHLIQQQFSCAEIEKICTVVDNLSSMNLSDQIMKSSEHFDKSCIANHLNALVNPSRTENKSDKLFDSLTPQNLDFLNSIGGQPGGRDLSRVSLYVKFDPLVQSPNANSLIDFNKEVITPTVWNNVPSVNSSEEVSKKLLGISPQKKLNDETSPISTSNKIYDMSKEDEMLIKNLQNEIHFLKNTYSEKEQVSKIQLEICKNENCLLKDKLKESFEKLKEIDSLKIIIEECFKVISKLTTEFESLKSENAKEIEVLTSERDSYINHLQATEAAFIQVLSKYEKCKNTIIYLKKNEASYKDLIATLTQKLKESKEKAKKAQEKAFEEFQNIQKELNETENSHNRELARIRAQLRKTELKLEDMQ